MLEIFAIIALCSKNSQNAKARGRSGGWAVGYTILLWVGLEFIGGFIGGMMDIGMGAYLIAILFAAIGGVTSYFIAKRGQPQVSELASAAGLSPDEAQWVQGAQPLQNPCRITIIREKSAVGMAVSYTLFLNGQQIGSLSNGGSVQAVTYVRQNMITATDIYGFRVKVPLAFDAPDGGHVEGHFKANRFLLEKTLVQGGSAYPAQQPAPAFAPPQQQAVQPQPPVQAQPAFVQPQPAPVPQPAGQSLSSFANQNPVNQPQPICSLCQSPVIPGDHKCRNCGNALAPVYPT